MSVVTTFRDQSEFMLCKVQDEFRALDARLIDHGCGLCLSGQIEQGMRFFQQGLEVAQERVEGLTTTRGLYLLGLGAAHLCREEVSEASDYYEQAEDIFLSIGNHFAEALTRFGLGLIEWAQGNYAEASRCFSKSLETLGQVPYDRRAKALRGEVSRMQREVVEAVAKATPPFRSERPEVELMPVVGEIPAGGPFNVSKCRIGEISTREILVNGKPYYFQSLDTAASASFGFAPGETYFSLRVTGTSMQDADIEDEDYVVVRRDKKPSPRRIVAARIEEEYTVKRYYPQNEYVCLQPESKTEKLIIVAGTRADAAMARHQHQGEDIELLVVDPTRFQLLGEVVAVLKKLAP